MLSPSKEKIFLIKTGGVPLNPYPANEQINLSLNNAASSFSIYAPLVLPQQNVLLVTKKIVKPTSKGFDLGLINPQHVVSDPVKKQSRHEMKYEALNGAGVPVEVQDKSDNLFQRPIKVLFFLCQNNNMLRFFQVSRLELSKLEKESNLKYKKKARTKKKTRATADTFYLV